jgi:uncharacterized protein YndB with AHSA1/START domain
MTPTPNGRLESLDGRLTLFVTRTFAAPIDDVWASITEPARLERWLGSWRGDPTTGMVLFRMGFEGEGAAEDEMLIRECDPPRRLAVDSRVGEEWWALEADLSEADGVTTLVFSQPGLDPEAAPSVGPGWEYYLDRLVAAETGGDLASMDWERDYYPAMAEHYQAQLGDQ